MINAEPFVTFVGGVIGDVAPVMMFLAAITAVGLYVDYLSKKNKNLEADERGSPIFDSYQSWDYHNTASVTSEDGSRTTVIIEHPIVDVFQTNYVKRWWGDA